MRIPFLRLLLVGGGAAVLATAGFAYMAANTVPVSSLGEGSAAVTGYAVSGIHYTTTLMPGPGGGPAGRYALSTVSFTLTGANAPTQVLASVDPAGPGGPPPPPPLWVQLTCLSVSGSGWVQSGAVGSGSFICTVPGHPFVPVRSVTTLDVEANQ